MVETNKRFHEIADFAVRFGETVTAAFLLRQGVENMKLGPPPSVAAAEAFSAQNQVASINSANESSPSLFPIPGSPFSSPTTAEEFADFQKEQKAPEKPPTILPDDNNNNKISDTLEQCVEEKDSCWEIHKIEENVALVQATTETEQELYSLKTLIESKPEFKNNPVQINPLGELDIFVVEGKNITSEQLDIFAREIGPVHASRISQVLFEEEQQSKPAVEEISQGQIPHNFEVVGLPAAQAAGWGGIRIPIIIMGTGLDQEVAGDFDVKRVGYDAENDKFCGEQGADCSDSFEGSAHNGHGNWVFAETKVIAPKSPIFTIKFINGIYTSDATTLRAINMILRNKGGPIVVNMSFEYPYGISPIADYAFRKLGERENIFPVAAGGNRSTNGCFEPAIYPFTLAVASVDVDPEIGNPVRWKTSAVCPQIDVAAPGHGFYATGPGPDYRPLYDNRGRKVRLSGSSFAAPYFTAGLALILGEIRQLQNPPPFSREDLFEFAKNHMTQPLDPLNDPNIDRLIDFYGPEILEIPNSLTGTGLLSFPHALIYLLDLVASSQLPSPFGQIDISVGSSEPIPQHYMLVGFRVGHYTSAYGPISIWRRIVLLQGSDQKNTAILYPRTTMPTVNVDAQGPDGNNYPVYPESFFVTGFPDNGHYHGYVQIDPSHPLPR